MFHAHDKVQVELWVELESDCQQSYALIRSTTHPSQSHIRADMLKEV